MERLKLPQPEIHERPSPTWLGKGVAKLPADDPAIRLPLRPPRHRQECPNRLVDLLGDMREVLCQQARSKTRFSWIRAMPRGFLCRSRIARNARGRNIPGHGGGGRHHRPFIPSVAEPVVAPPENRGARATIMHDRLDAFGIARRSGEFQMLQIIFVAGHRRSISATAPSSGSLCWVMQKSAAQQKKTGANGTLVKDPKTGEYRAAKD